MPRKNSAGGDDPGVSSSILVKSRHPQLSFLFITDLPVIAGMTPDPNAYRASMFAVARYKDSHHRCELGKRHPVDRTTGRAPPQPCTRVHPAGNELVSRPPSFPRSNRLLDSSFLHAGAQSITCRMLSLLRRRTRHAGSFRCSQA